MDDNLPESIFDKIVNLYKEAVKRLPAIKYSWGLVAIICILALINFFKLGDTKVVFRSALLALGVIFLIFIFSFLTRTNDKAIRYGMYILTYAIILTTTALVIGFALHTLTPIKIPFYEKLLAAHSDTTATDTTKIINRLDTASTKIDTANKNDRTKQDSPRVINLTSSSTLNKTKLNGNKYKSKADTESKKKEITVPPQLCTVLCNTKGIIGVEVSFKDPATGKSYSKVSDKNAHLDFEVPCDLAEKYIEVTFTKNGKSDYRTQKLSQMQIPD